MEGISKKALLAVRMLVTDPVHLHIINSLVDACIELSPCLPIDDNTPKDRRLNLYWKKYGWFTGQWRCSQFMCDAGLLVPVNIQPTYYKELPQTTGC